VQCVARWGPARFAGSSAPGVSEVWGSGRGRTCILDVVVPVLLLPVHRERCNLLPQRGCCLGTGSTPIRSSRTRRRRLLDCSHLAR